MFADFDFSALDDITFKEDAVREEIIAPILRQAGYKPTGSMRVERSKPLKHPFVMIGSKKHPVSIIPDYTLFHDDKALMILDAKKPSEEIVNSIHVEQAYSYAIHPEVRCQIFGLCNGRHLSFFNVGRREALLVIATPEIDVRWAEVSKYFSPTILRTPEILDFDADLGLHAYRAGVREGTLFRFNGYHLQLAMAISEHLWTVSSSCSVNDREHLISFDLGAHALERILLALCEEDRSRVLGALKRGPFQAELEGQIIVDCTAFLGPITQGAYEVFAPFRIAKVLASRYDPTAVLTPRLDGMPSDIPDWMFRLSRR
jgi:hypothetical protein